MMRVLFAIFVSVISALGAIPKTLNPDELLRDIKPLVEIPDNSIYLYYGLISIAVIFVSIVIYLTVRWILSQRKVNKAKEYLESLNSITWSSPKKAAYSITHYGRLLATDERREKLFEQLVPMLDEYKYKKEVSKVAPEIKEQFELYKKVCNESV